ncbi:MAG TPA: ABC transporter permease [Propioniciclava sp.]|uniref:ABC transporter permease n=1 Tax=Propioniciclava sp. TaxID=2038686 RepID=UPI002CAC3238|nr:ABC transporter permease [Propioniciclava sp.]HRL50017.1 ABC transporter permease [Propioniciclava sp.]HRL80180.1 ABC transporter permease [Propioniciclava sp.]
MRRGLLLRLSVLVASLAAASLVIFWITQALPGDVARVMLGDGASPEQLAAKRAELGTDRPFLVQYGAWAGGLLHGDFGASWYSTLPVAALIGPRAAVTGWLITGGLLVAIAVALPLGALAALHRRRIAGFAVSASAQVGMAIPAFWAGILLSMLFAVQLRWLPANGYVPLTRDPAAWAEHLILPIVALGLVQAAVLIRYVRSSFLDVLGEDYYRTARSIGWTRGAALWRHGIRNAALSLVTVIGLQLSALIVGAIVIERVFVLPGLGSLLLDSVSQFDLAIVRGIVMILVAVVLVVNGLIDMAYVIIDPRLRQEGST